MSQTATHPTILRNDFSYNGNPRVKRDGVQTPFTDQEVSEYLKCMQDPVYFARNYAKVISLDKGIVPFDLWPYQDKMFRHFESNRFSIVLAPRQSGKSISSCIYLLWYALFHPEKTIAILANKGSTAREMVSRITLALENLPFFLQPGCRALNKGSIEFSNNSKILAAATTGSSIRGLSISLLFLDEFAFVSDAATFYTSTYPVITSGKTSRVVISSTPKGIGNMFHKLWEGAVQGTNDFKPFRVNWWDVPGRDEKWKEETIRNTSELQFTQEFLCQFLGTGSTLINAEALLGLKASSPVHEANSVRIYQNPDPTHTYIMTVDVGRGRSQDYSTFTVIDVTARPFKQVATYRNNTISPLLFPDVIHKYARLYNEAYVIVESNDQGSVVCNGLYYDWEYENMYLESAVKAGAIGLETTKKVKRIGCSNLKDLVETRKLEIVDPESILELSTFEESGNSWEASDNNHDDLVMNLVLFAWYAATDSFQSDNSVNLKEMMYQDRLRAIEEDVTPVGFMPKPDEDPLQPAREVDSQGVVWTEAYRTEFL